MCPLPRLAGTAALLITLTGGLQAASPDALSGPPPAWQPVQGPQAVAAECQASLGQARSALLRLRQQPPDSQWLRKQDAFVARIEDWGNRLTFLANVHPDKAVRSAAEACELRWNTFFSSLGQDPALYRAARQVQPADETDRNLLTTMLQDFVDAGVSLPPAQRTRARRLNDHIAALGQFFWRMHRPEVLVQAAREAVWEKLRQHHPGIEVHTRQLTDILAASIAARCEIPVHRVQDAFHMPAPHQAHNFIPLMRDLQTMRMKL